MGHLTFEELARLVDEAPGPDEKAHLEACVACSAELQALRDQTGALAALPDLMPPGKDWSILEARLRSEGLIRDVGIFARLTLAHTPNWMRAAAAVLLFLGGAGTGALWAGRPGGALAVAGNEAGADAAAADVLASGSPEARRAFAEVRRAEARYVNALTRYREVLEAEGEGTVPGDPAARMAALQYLVAAGQAAVRQAPADPFLNGLLASTLAEREVTLRRISSRQDNWF
ncbi:MAG: hypothetical protein ACE5GJ_00180 [Gemmatimonadota bacterium]